MDVARDPASWAFEPVAWSDSEGPLSARYGDRYRSRTGGLAQARQVFLAGCGLPDPWRGMRSFTVLETGFGLGLNFLATWAAWEADPQRSAALHFVSVEAHPVAADDIVRSADAAQQDSDLLADGADDAAAASRQRIPALARTLAEAWDGLAPGHQQLHFAEGRVSLRLALGDARSMLEQLECTVDAVFLDGFSPDRNPDMWSPATLRAVASCCRPGTRLATYTVAQPVRATLGDLGFRVEKLPGLPPKRHRLQAVFRPEARHAP